MKKNNLIRKIPLAVALITIVSCGTTKNIQTSEPEQNLDQAIEVIVEDEFEGRTEKKGPKPLTVKKQSNQQEEDFINSLKDIELKIVSEPKPVVETQNFRTPYTILVENSNGPVKDFNVTISFPSSKNKDSVIYDSIQQKTDENGKITFNPGKADFAINDKVTFYPTPINSSKEIVEASNNLAVTSPYKVKSVNIWHMGILYVYDFNERGNPTINSTDLLRSLRNLGINVGNAPISSTSYYDKPLYQLYKDNYAIVGNSCRFMVFGSIKYAEPVSESADGFTTTMVADITCLNMKDGSELCKFQITETNTNSVRYKSVEECKKALIDKVVEQIIYGM